MVDQVCVLDIVQATALHANGEDVRIAVLPICGQAVARPLRKLFQFQCQNGTSASLGQLLDPDLAALINRTIGAAVPTELELAARKNSITSITNLAYGWDADELTAK